ncbi:MAG: FtsH protease activity modulator HflK [Isosphaeraceae bacterium]
MRLLVFGEWTALPPFRQLRSLGESVRRWDDRLDPGHAIEGVLAHWKVLARLAAAAGILWYASSGWTAIRPDEVGLLQRFGRYAGKLEPGLHLRWPSPIETVTRLQADQVRSMSVGFRTGASADASASGWAASHGRGLSSTEEEESLLLTGDGHLVELAASTQYRLDPTREEALREFAFGVSSPEDALRSLAESSVRQVVGRTSLEALLTSGRSEAEREAAKMLQSRIDRYGLGLRVNAVTFQEVHPPLAVVDAYRDVSRAESDRQRRRNEAAAYLAGASADAQGRAEATRNRSEAERSTLMERTRSEADSFRYLTDARAGYPVLTDLALYWDTIARTLTGRPKVLLDPGRGAPRHLIVPEVGMGSFGPADVSTLVGPPRPSGSRPAQ